MHPIVSFGIGVVILGFALSMLREKTSANIRKSRYWPIACLGYIFGISTAGKLMIPLYAEANIDDEKAVPILFGTMVTVVIVMYAVTLYRLRRQVNETGYKHRRV